MWWAGRSFHKYAAGIVAAVALVTVGIIAPQLGSRAASGTTIPTPSVIATRGMMTGSPTLVAKPANAISEEFTGWKYDAGVQDGTITVSVHYDVASRQGIEAFSAANRQLISQVHAAIPVSIVFRRPLSVSEFQDVVQKSGVQVKDYTIRAVDNKGMRVTIGGAPRGTDLVPQTTLDMMLAKVDKLSPGTAFKGIVTVDAVADQGQLNALLVDSRVYTTDVSQAIATERARAKYAATNAAVARLPVDGGITLPLYWFMENVGIAPK